MDNILYKRNDCLIAATMNEETVMMDVISGKYYSLGVTGGAIWEMLESPLTLEMIVEELLLQFAVDKEICMKQVKCFLESAMEKQIIQRV